MGSNLLILFATALSLQLPQSPSEPSQTSPAYNPVDDDEQPAAGFAYERLSDAVGYNRVQGLSLGAGYRLPLFRRTDLYATVRYGVSDERLTGRLTAVSDAGMGQVALSGYDDVADIDPFATGRSLANSMNALFTAHDDGDYLLALGGSASFVTELAPTLELRVIGRVERHISIRRTAESEVNDLLGGDGEFPENPAVEEGTFATFSAGVRGLGRTRWELTADVLTGDSKTVPRLYGHVRRKLGWHDAILVQVNGGLGADQSVPQMLFRLGGLHTVRGFEYGTSRAPSFWAAQVDVVPLKGRVRPLVFIDAGQAADTDELFSSRALVGAGAGVALLSGLVQLQFSRPVSPDEGAKIRFDLVLQVGQ
jgi:hypothetical protein